MTGRVRKPTMRTREQEHADRLKVMRVICERLADGESLSSICGPGSEDKKKIPGIPPRTMVLRWVSDYPDIRDMYARARGFGVDVWGDELRDISDKVLGGKVDPNAGRVAADIMKWTMARMSPRKWSDRAIEESFRNQSDGEAGAEYRGIPAHLVGPSFGGFLHDVRMDAATYYWHKGGRGSLKSTTISEVIIDDLMRHPGGHAICLRDVHNTLADSTYSQLIWSISQMGLEDYFTARKSPLSLTVNATGQTIFFRGLDDPLKLKSIKPKFGYIRNVWFEEVAEMDGMETIRNVLQSIMRGGEKFNVYFSYNPPKSKNNWVNLAVEQESLRPDTKVYHTDYLTVPRIWLGEPFIVQADVLKEMNPTAYEHEYLGVPTGTGGDVFDNVVLEEMSADFHTEVTRQGVDFGFAVDPFVWLKLGYNRLYDTLYIMDEIYRVKMHDNEAAAAIKAKKAPSDSYVIGDSADPKAVDNLRREGLRNVQGCTKFPGSRDHGYKFLQRWKRIVIDKRRCPNAAREFVGCEYERDKHGNFLSVIPKCDDHTIDAARYGLDKEINQFQPAAVQFISAR